MKKFIIFLFLYLFSFNYSFADTSFKWGQKYEGVISVRDTKVSLPEGVWTLVAVDGWFIKGIEFKSVIFVQEENNVFKDIVEIGVLGSYGQFQGAIDAWMQEVFFYNRDDGCYERKEYYLVEVYKYGAAFNCFIVRHEETWKELFDPDDLDAKDGYVKPFNNSWVRKWIRDNNIEVPKIMLSDMHAFFAKSVSLKIIAKYHAINPELYGAKKTKFSTEEDSEYHKHNIEKHPEAKKFMENFIKQSAARHVKFENEVKAKQRHKLNLSEWYMPENEKNISKKKNKKTKNYLNLTEQLRELKKLYDEGILTEEEFTKAKKKLLN